MIVFALDNWAEVDAYVEAYRAELERQEALLPGPGTIRIRQLQEMLAEADTKYGSDPEWQSLPVLEKLRRIESEKGTGIS